MNTGIMCLFSKCFPHAILLHLIAGLPHLTILTLIHEYTVLWKATENISSKVKVRHKFRKDLIQEVCIKIGAHLITQYP